MRALASWPILLVAACAACAPNPVATAQGARAELAPTGRLRAGMVVSVCTASFACTDRATGKAAGVPVDLAAHLARKLDVPLEIVAYASPAQLTDDASSGKWDVAFLVISPARQRVVDFAPPYGSSDIGYLVRSGLGIERIADVNRAGTRVAVVRASVSHGAAEQASPAATLIPVATVKQLGETLAEGRADVIASGHATLVGIQAGLPGARLLPGNIHTTLVAAGVPRERKAALEYLTHVIEEAKASGLVQQAMERAGVRDVAIPR